jgi:hypothetical protein
MTNNGNSIVNVMLKYSHLEHHLKHYVQDLTIGNNFINNRSMRLFEYA